MLKEIIKAMFDIAKTNDVAVDVAATMFIHNINRKDNINKGSDFDYTQEIKPNTIDEAVEFLHKNYELLVEANANGNINKVFEETEE